MKEDILKKILTKNLYVEEPTPREVALLASLDETDDIKFVPENVSVIDEVESSDKEEVKDVEIVQEKVAEEKVETVAKENDEEVKAIERSLVALNNVPADGKRNQEEDNKLLFDDGSESRLDKKQVLALNNLDEPRKEEPVVEEVKPEDKQAEKPAKEETHLEEKEEPVQDEEETEENGGKKIKGSITENVGESGNSKVPGKYEVFPEDDEFKYRLRANNGEILVVSYGYTTREGAHNGIETLKKNLETGVVTYITDKHNRSQWRLNTNNDARIVALGETYSSVNSARNAFASTQKFGKTDRIIDLDEIPHAERRTWEFTAEKEEEKDSGVIEIYEDNGKFRARLLANNSEVLFVTAQSYSTKQSLKVSLENIKEKLNVKAFHISKDKQDKYQFIMESGTGFVYLVGETYSTAATAKSAAASVLAFINKAKVVDLTLKQEE